MAVALLVLILAWWIYLSRPTTFISLSDGLSCRVSYHELSTGSCVMRIFREQVPVGRVKLSSGLFTHPWAFLPGPDGKKVICFSRLDTTYAVFAVEIDKPSVGIPENIQPAVDASEFLVRPCSNAEVAYLNNLISKTSSAELGKYVRSGRGDEVVRANLLKFLRLATSPHNYADPVLKDARPQVLPSS